MSKAKTTEIQASSRASVKCGDSFYTVEYMEKRSIAEDCTKEELELERQALWDTVNSECDNQVVDILKTYKIK